MLEKIKLLGILIAIPLLGFFVLGWVRGKLDQDWTDALRQDIKDITPEKLALASLDRVCSIPELASQIDETCSTHSRVKMARTLSLWTGIGSIAFLLLITAAGAVCKVDRKLLLFTFAPGLYLSNAAVSIAVVLQGTILIAAVWYGESAAIGRVHVKLLILVAIGAALGALSIIRATFRIVHKAKAVVIGKTVKPQDHPELWRFVTALSASVGTEPPHNLVIGLEPNFFVTEADVQCLDGEVTGRTMCLSAPLCRILSREELKAILAHEYGHFVGSDTRFSLKFYPIYRGASDSLQAVARAAAQSGSGGLVLIPAIHMLAFFLERFAGAENKISRERELAADAVAAKAGGTRDIATGLVKVVAFSGVWTDIQETMLRSLQEGKPVEVNGKACDPVAAFSNMSALFSNAVENHASPESLAGLDSKIIPHPTDSHPPLSVRLKCLGFALDDLARDALNVRPTVPASALIERAEELEVELSMVEQRFANPNAQTGSPEPVPAGASPDREGTSRP